MRRTMESVAAERLNKIGIRDHNIANGSDADNENTSVSPDAPDVSAIVSALAHQQSEDESSNSDENECKIKQSSSDPNSLHVAKDLHQVLISTQISTHCSEFHPIFKIPPNV